jgi:hypothetical protein
VNLSIRFQLAQTQGKVERHHQTMQKFPYQQDGAENIAQLQMQIDRFVTTTTEEG